MPEEVFHVESHDKVKNNLRENSGVKSSLTLRASNNNSFNEQEQKGIQDSCQESNVSNGMTKMAPAQQKMLRYGKTLLLDDAKKFSNICSKLIFISLLTIIKLESLKTFLSSFPTKNALKQIYASYHNVNWE